MPVLLEGHANWVDRQVTTRVFGESADHRQARKSLRYKFHTRIPGIRCFGGPGPDAYEKGSVLIAHAAEAHGLDLVNRVWKDVSRLPTADEIAAPEKWVRRIAI